MEPKKIEMGKKYRTRGGEETVRVLCVDAGGELPVVALIGKGAYQFTQDGHYFTQRESSFDLLEIPEERTGWLNIYKSGSIYLYNTRTEADDAAGPYRIACIPIAYHVGQGLEEK